MFASRLDSNKKIPLGLVNHWLGKAVEYRLDCLEGVDKVHNFQS